MSIELTGRKRHHCVDFEGSRALAAAEVLPSDSAIDEAFIECRRRGVLEAGDRICSWVTE